MGPGGSLRAPAELWARGGGRRCVVRSYLSLFLFIRVYNTLSSFFYPWSRPHPSPHRFPSFLVFDRAGACIRERAVFSARSLADGRSFPRACGPGGEPPRDGAGSSAGESPRDRVGPRDRAGSSADESLRDRTGSSASWRCAPAG